MEGKGNLDKPYAIFRALGIPAYVLWDCDKGTKEKAASLALRRLVTPTENVQEAPPQTAINAFYAHFEDTLEALLKIELTADIHAECLKAACDPFGLTPSEDNHKVPEVMYRVLDEANDRGRPCPTLKALVTAIWLHLTGEALVTDIAGAQAAA